MNDNHPKSWTDAFARWGAQRTWTVIVIGLVLAGIGLYGTLRLKVDQDLKALLPRDHASIERLNEVTARLGAQSDLIVSIESPDRDANLRYGTALVAKMRTLKELRYVQFQRDISFFKDRGLLFVPTKDLLELRKKVIARIKRETEKELTGDEDAPAKPAAAAGGPVADEEDVFDLDEEELRKKYLGNQEAPTEYLEADEGQIIVIKARPTEPSTNVEFARTLLEKTETMIAEVDVKKFHPEMKATAQGEYVQRVGSTSGMRTDVLAGAAFALGLLLVVIGVYFKRVQAVPIIVVPVIVSTLVTQAFGAGIYEKYNLVTTFIFAIVLGLGIEFGIHTLARYGHERARGLSLHEGLRVALASTGAAVTTGGITTLSVFFLLLLGDFQGFAQFGVMAGIGVLLALIFTFFLMPALVAAIDKVFPWQKRETDLESDAPPAPSSTRGMGLAVVILVISFGFTAFSAWKAGSVSFEYDFTKLDAPPKPSPKPEGPPKKDYKDAVGRATTKGPAVALCDTTEHCAEMARTLAAVKAVTLTDANGDRAIDPDILVRLEAIEQGKPLPPPKVTATEPVATDEEEEEDEDDPFAKRKKADPFEALEKELAASPVSPDQWELLKRLGSLRSSEIVYFLDAYLALYTFVPTDQERKLQIIADVRKRVDAKKSLLKDESKKKVDDFRRYLDVNEPIEVADLPVWVTEQLVDTEGHLGRFIIMWNRGAKADYRDSKRLHDAYFDFPVTGGTVGVAANFFVLVDVIDTLRKDGPVVLSAAVIAVFVCLLFFFRS
ncbi:MAG: MMPL family transporter, partial [Myxococcales bacterium]|nr:MMPL family transporter [Myxococcales bacterium]